VQQPILGAEQMPMRKQWNLQQLDQRDSTLLKGLAIVFIVLHNFFHFVSPARQNEFTFDPGAYRVFLQEVVRPSHAIQAFFSFFGFLGIQAFIFISAYGLAKSHWDGPATWTEFMRSRIKKLYPMFLLIVLPWLIATTVLAGPWSMVHSILLPVVAALLGVSTLLGFGLPPVGPWWFIPFIMQMYALWFGLRWVARRFGWQGLLAMAAAGIAITCVFNPLLASRNINLLMTPIGRMPAICLGILAARYPVRIHGWLASIGVAVLLLGNAYAALFPFAAFGSLLAMLWIYDRVRGLVRDSGLLFRIGECSLLIFLLNAIVRNQLVSYASTPGWQLYCGFISAALSIAVANLIARLVETPRVKKPASVPVLGTTSEV